MPLPTLPQLSTWAQALGFQKLGITDLNVAEPAAKLEEWLAQHYHGEMSFMERHADLRTHPEGLVPQAKRAIVVRMDYQPLLTTLPRPQPFITRSPRLTHPPRGEVSTVLAKGEANAQGYVSLYAHNRDYHTLIRKRLAALAQQMETYAGQPLVSRSFADSAPVLEKPLAVKAGLGWQGKHTNLINAKAGSWFFLGVLYVDWELPLSEPMQKSHCGTCTACIDICPTQAIVAPYQLDARRCISYLTIEHKGTIPSEFRQAIGNRIYGCDDCQLICPWNRFAKASHEMAFQSTRGLNNPDLVELFAWSESDFLNHTEGSAIRRIGYERWLRNIAVALGNVLRQNPNAHTVKAALRSRQDHPSALVREHVAWALEGNS